MSSLPRASSGPCRLLPRALGPPAPVAPTLPVGGLSVSVPGPGLAGPRFSGCPEPSPHRQPLLRGREVTPGWWARTHLLREGLQRAVTGAGPSETGSRDAACRSLLAEGRGEVGKVSPASPPPLPLIPIPRSWGLAQGRPLLVCAWEDAPGGRSSLHRGQGSGVRSATRGHGPAAWLPAAHAGWSDSACPAVPEAGRPRASAPRDPAAGPGPPPPPAPAKAGRTAVSCQEGAPGSRDRAAPGDPRWWGAAAHLAQRDRGRTRGLAEPAGAGAVAERPSAGGPPGPNPREAWPGRGWPEGAGQGGGGTATSTGGGRLAVSELGVPAEPWASLAAAEAPLAADAVRVPAAEVRWRPASPGGQAPARAPCVSCRRRSAVRVVPSVTHRPGSLPPGLGRRWLGRLSEDRF